MSATVEINRSQNNNLTRVYLGNVVIWFSYDTPVAYHVPGSPRVVSVNRWSQTTGRHLNEIDNGNKADRVSGEEFEAGLSEIMDRINAALETIGAAR